LNFCVFLAIFVAFKINFPEDFGDSPQINVFKNCLESDFEGVGIVFLGGGKERAKEKIV